MLNANESLKLRDLTLAYDRFTKKIGDAMTAGEAPAFTVEECIDMVELTALLATSNGRMTALLISMGVPIGAPTTPTHKPTDTKQ